MGALALITAWYRSAATGSNEELPLTADDPARNSWRPERAKRPEPERLAADRHARLLLETGSAMSAGTMNDSTIARSAS